MNFDELIEESYKGFGQSAHVNTDDLRRLYYGRRDVFVCFSNDGVYETKAGNSDLDRPDSILAFPVNDVVGRRVGSNAFYANVFRANTGGFLKDIKSYNREDFLSDSTLLTYSGFLPKESIEALVEDHYKNGLLRSYFEKLWELTGEMADKMSGDLGSNWRRLFLFLGYTGIFDTYGTGLLSLSRSPTILYFEYDKKTELDILPIQKHRVDPRRRTAEKVERQVNRLSTKRNRVAKEKR